MDISCRFDDKIEKLANFCPKVGVSFQPFYTKITLSGKISPMNRKLISKYPTDNLKTIKIVQLTKWQVLGQKLGSTARFDTLRCYFLSIEIDQFEKRTFRLTITNFLLNTYFSDIFTGFSPVCTDLKNF